MKSILKYSCSLLLASALVTGCSKFDEINEPPFLARENQVQVE